MGNDQGSARQRPPENIGKQRKPVTPPTPPPPPPKPTPTQPTQPKK